MPKQGLTIHTLPRAHLGGPEVGELDHPVPVHQNVSPLDIPVDDLALVEILQALQQLARVHAHERLAKPPKPLEHAVDGSARHVLQKDVEGPGGVIPLHVDVAHDVPVVTKMVEKGYEDG